MDEEDHYESLSIQKSAKKNKQTIPNQTLYGVCTVISGVLI